MASVYHLYHDAANIKYHIVSKYDDFTYSDRIVYFAAVKIQCNWRGYRDRKMIKFWNKNALIINKTVRGWLVRMKLPKIMEDHYYRIKEKFFHRQATIIQAFWKGYWVRSRICDIKEIMQEREELLRLNEQLKQELEDAFRQRGTSKQKFSLEINHDDIEVKNKVLSILYNQHHLLRTYQQEGVYSIHRSAKLSYIEQILKNMDFKNYMKEKQKEQFAAHKEKLLTDNYDFNLNTKVIKLEPYERLMMTQN